MSAAPAQSETVDVLARVFSDLRALGTFLEIRTKDAEVVTFDVDRWHEEQRKFDRARTGRDIVLKPRQIGFSTLELARDLQFALAHPGAQVVVVAHDRELVQSLFLTLKTMADGLAAAGLLPTPRYDNVREIVFRHTRSAIRVTEAGATSKTAKKKGRSGTIHRLHVTELAFWDAALDTMNALLGAVPVDGEVVIESTPNGAAGMFYAMALEALLGRGDYRLHFFPWYEHRAYRLPLPGAFDPKPRDRWERKLRDLGCDDEQIAWWRSKVDNPAIGLDLALQEFPIDPKSCFRMAGGAWLPPDAVDVLEETVAAPISTIEIRGAPLMIYVAPEGAERYIIGGDVSEGIGLDGSALCVIRERDGATCATWCNDRIEPGDFGLTMADVGRLYRGAQEGALLAPERNKDGAATLRAIKVEARYPEHLIYTFDDGRKGWATTPTSRPILFDELGRAIRESAKGARRDDETGTTGKITLRQPDAGTVSEARTIVRDPEDGKPRAQNKGTPGGAKDDRFIAWAIAWAVRARPRYAPKSGRA